MPTLSYKLTGGGGSGASLLVLAESGGKQRAMKLLQMLGAKVVEVGVRDCGLSMETISDRLVGGSEVIDADGVAAEEQA